MRVQAKIVIGDNRASLKQMKDASVQTVVTSPPYWGLRDYGTAHWTGGDESCEHIKDPSKTKKFGNDEFNKNRPSREATKLPDYYYKDLCESCGAVRVDEQIGLEKTPDDFIEQLCLVFDEVWRVLKDDGTIWVNLGDSYAGNNSRASNNGRAGFGNEREGVFEKTGEGLKHKDLAGIPWRFAFAMQARGWYLRSDIIWHKPNPMPESVTDRPTKSHEYIFLMTKSPRYFYDHEAIKEKSSYPNDKRRPLGSKGAWQMDGRTQGENGGGKAYDHDTSKRNRRSVWTIATKPFRGAHFAVMPKALVAPCILAGSKKNDTVLDPFSGSGTTGEVALKHGRNYIGLELNPEYAAISEKRIIDALGMFVDLEMSGPIGQNHASNSDAN